MILQKMIKHCIYFSLIFLSFICDKHPSRRITRILRICGISFPFAWGNVVQFSSSKTTFLYDSSTDDKLALHLFQPRFLIISMRQASFLGYSKNMEDMWNFLSKQMMWHIWKARCVKAFEGNHVPELEVVKDIWMQCIYILRGQYDDSHGSSDEDFMQSLALQAEWKDNALYIMHNVKLRWKYTTPRSLLISLWLVN